ncbi:patatin-like phospholipase family protein [Oribacterium sp. WCC10]|uniref:patatin-like phospholipase family protein n=1 Tax=Oribacterium sp. WCC10 TaxID=1855343 RepID=UPI0008EDDE20|nr:patatin family protein [Oribacterium sp. WCC10]SFG09632.1 Predicted phospholipase, patatin/cPLA2 family [Oribacterium sp. WCC10]
MNEKTKKTGLVCEGGAMRGLFTAGVLDVFLENDISFDGMVGVSAGATFGCNYKSRQIGRTIRYSLQFANDKRFGSFESLIKTGDLFDVEFCYHTLPNEIFPFDWDTFLDNPMKFYLVATDVKTGKPVYHEIKDRGDNELEWMRASASMPLVSKPVHVDGYELLDGGISNSIPLEFFEHIGYNRNVVILTQDSDYRKPAMKGLPAAKLLLKKQPAIYTAMEQRHIMYNAQLDYINKREQSGEIFVIRPPKPLDIKRTEHDTDELERVYKLGRSTATEALSDIKDFLNKP